MGRHANFLSFWTQPLATGGTRDDVLIEQWGQGFLAESIGLRVGATKNAVCGRARRLAKMGRLTPRREGSGGMPGNRAVRSIKGAPKVRRPPPPSDDVTSHARTVRFRGPRFIKTKASPVRATRQHIANGGFRVITTKIVDTCASLATVILPDLALSKTVTCGWIDGDPKTAACGKAAVRGRGFCPDHLVKAHPHLNLDRLPVKGTTTAVRMVRPYDRVA